jgi:MFS family permease
MQNNPYVPPVAELKDAPRPPGSPVKAIVLGFLIDVLGTLLGVTILGVGYTFVMARQGLSAEQMQSVMQKQSMTTPFGLTSLLVGTAFSVLGGWICSRIVRRNELKFGAILAALITLIGLVLAGTERMSSPELVVTSILTVVAVMGGAALGRSGNKA